MADFGALFDRKRKLGTVAKESAATTGVQDVVAEPSVAQAKKKRKKKKKQRPDEETGQQQALMRSAAQRTPASGSAPASTSGDRQHIRMTAQLAGAHFRYINETLYTRPSADAVELFREEPRLYEAYHEGFRLQAARWPQRPVQLIAEWLRATQPVTRVVADLGCGDAELAASVPHRVHSFDLVACNERVTACDIAHVPLGTQSVHVAVFCLALMGSNFADFLCEAHRLLRPRGVLKVAEVSSRITDAAGWDMLLHAIGFDEVARDSSNTHFVMYEYRKSERPRPAEGLPEVALKACAYKKR